MKNIIISVILLLCAGNMPAQEKLKIRVMTYNIRFGELASLKELAMQIKTFNPDFVALQEVDCNTHRERAPRQNGKNFISEIAYHTGMFGLYGKTIDYKGGYYGIGILSKYPYVNIHKTLLPRISEEYEQRAILEGVFEVDGDTLIFASTHLDAKRNDTRELQADFICNHFEKSAYPLVIGGDFNSVPSSNVIKRMKIDWFYDPDTTFTVSAKNPIRRIDYLFARPMKGWKVIRSQVVPTLLSDHLPVVADLEYQDKKH
ncbi:endonuclease/exonuclease/phosphatase family protein [uncultured Bacteroides sp.]|uniref:endonuclease/exonuclease/phosphatase family protein n=1 Tax=uncultured Bacteroides sp. TaxID=162156 RepID=UPI0025F030F8|nr:endonuclease/exonuclease/phosphatase family protein [uncultured Bacteroides sp.]